VPEKRIQTGGIAVASDHFDESETLGASMAREVLLPNVRLANGGVAQKILSGKSALQNRRRLMYASVGMSSITTLTGTPACRSSGRAGSSASVRERR
jgi:hypothetical protein